MKFLLCESVEKRILFHPERFSHQSLKPITAHSGKRSSGNKKSRLNSRRFTGMDLDGALHQFASQNTAIPPELVDDPASSKARPLFHPGCFLALVAHSEFLPSFCSSAGKNTAAVLRGHPRPKTVRILSLTLMRLICPFQGVIS